MISKSFLLKLNLLSTLFNSSATGLSKLVWAASDTGNFFTILAPALFSTGIIASTADECPAITVCPGQLKLTDQIIKLIYLGDSEITILFDKKTLDLKGWKIIDRYNNNINFSLNIVAKNDVFKKGTFKIPEMN